MAEATYRQPGNHVDYTPGGAVDAGEVVVQNELVGVATAPIAANALGSIAVEGVFDVQKDTGSADAINAGALVYWDSGNEVATTTSGGNKLMGKCIRAAAAGAATVRVKLSQ